MSNLSKSSLNRKSGLFSGEKTLSQTSQNLLSNSIAHAASPWPSMTTRIRPSSAEIIRWRSSWYAREPLFEAPVNSRRLTFFGPRLRGLVVFFRGLICPSSCGLLDVRRKYDRAYHTDLCWERSGGPRIWLPCPLPSYKPRSNHLQHLDFSEPAPLHV